MEQFAVTVFTRLYAAAYKVHIFNHFVRAYNRRWLAMKGGLHFLFHYFIEWCRWRSSFLGNVFSTNSFFTFYSLQHHVHICYRRTYVFDRRQL